MKKTFTHLHASEYIHDTETTITVYSNVVEVEIRCLPGLRYWSRPSTATIRKWVDAALKGTGTKRDGARVESRGELTKWYYTYYLTNQ